MGFYTAKSWIKISSVLVFLWPFFEYLPSSLITFKRILTIINFCLQIESEFDLQSLVSTLMLI